MKQLVRRLATAVMLGLGFVALVGSTASAQTAQTERTYTGVAPPVVGQVLSNTGERSTPPPAVQPGGVLPAQGAVLPFQVSAGPPAPRAAAQGLAFTGADIAGLVTIALVALTAGIVLTRRARPDGSN